MLLKYPVVAFKNQHRKNKNPEINLLIIFIIGA